MKLKGEKVWLYYDKTTQTWSIGEKVSERTRLDEIADEEMGKFYIDRGCVAWEGLRRSLERAFRHGVEQARDVCQVRHQELYTGDVKPAPATPPQPKLPEPPGGWNTIKLVGDVWILGRVED